MIIRFVPKTKLYFLHLPHPWREWGKSIAPFRDGGKQLIFMLFY